jgi:hypothetical protein
MRMATNDIDFPGVRSSRNTSDYRPLCAFVTISWAMPLPWKSPPPLWGRSVRHEPGGGGLAGIEVPSTPVPVRIRSQSLPLEVEGNPAYRPLCAFVTISWAMPLGTSS